MLLFCKEFRNCTFLVEFLVEMELHDSGILTDTPVIASIGFLSLRIQQVGTAARIIHKPSG